MKTLPYYKQQTPFTCSLACLRMVLGYIGRKFTEYELSKVVSCKPNLGFSPSMILRICEIIDVGCKIRFEATISQVKKLLSKGICPIALLNPGILYRLKNIEHNHYVIIKDISEEGVIINDPDQEYGGENREVGLPEFLKAWKDVHHMITIIKGEKNDNKTRSV